MTYNKPHFIDNMLDSPVIAAVKSDEDLKKALSSNSSTIIFFLYGTILNIANLVKTAKDSGRMVFIHVDLVEGLTGKDISVDFIKHNTIADGIISTRFNLIKRARELELITIQRFFLLDSLSFENVLRQSSYADAIDILPGTMPRVIERLSKKIRQPIIASGLLFDKQDIISALSAGALAVSTTNAKLWDV